MADDIQELSLIDPSADFQSVGMSSLPFSPAKLEDDDDYLNLLPPDAQPPSSLRSNFRSKKRNRVMQSCVACHSQKRKCDRKRPCTRCTEHGIAGQCVYQLEDPAVRDGPEQDELLRLRSRVRELERTVRVLMQKPLSRRAAAALEAETDAILGTTSTRKRKVEKDKDGDDRLSKLPKLNTHTSSNGFPEWVTPDPSFPSPIDSPFSPYAPTPSDYNYNCFQYPHDFNPPSDVPTPPYSTFPTPSSDAGSPFKVPEPPARRFSGGTTLANMLSHTSMATPESLAASSPASASVVSFAPLQGVAPPHECGCGVNPIGSEVLAGLSLQLEAAHGVISTLPDHQMGGACVTVLGIASLIDAIATATRSNQSTPISAPPVQQPPPGPQPMPMTAPAVGPPPPPPSTVSFIGSAPSTHMTPASTSHMSPASHMSPSVSEPGPSPHSTIATPPNYGLYSVSHGSQPFYHAEVPTVVGFNSLSSWAAYGGSTSFLNHANNSSSSLANFDGTKDGHPHGHHHGHPNGNIIVYDHAQQ